MKISIATVTYNAERFIEQTIQSVAAQDYNNIEYIVIDGDSTDNTLQILNDHRKQIDILISEPDNGISDAMNKALSVFTGDYLLFVHADDFLISPDSISSAATAITADQHQHDIYAFSILFGQPDGQNQLIHSRAYSPWTNLKNNIRHQGALCSRQCINTTGLFPVKLKIAMDYDWFLKAYRKGMKAKTFGQPITFMRDSGISSNLNWHDLKKRLDEEKIIHNRHCKSAAMKLAYKIWWALYPIYRKLKTAE